MPYMIQKNADGEHCVFKEGADGKPEGDTLGCHPSRPDAQQQIAAIWANEGAAGKGLSMSAEDMEALCPECAEKMRASGIKNLAFKQMPEQMLTGLCDSLGNDPGLFGRCMERSFGGFSAGDKQSFCAWLHHECTGQWPAEKEGGEGEKAAELPIDQNTAVKAAGDWELDVLGVPFGGPDSKDTDGQWFDKKTDLHEDKWALPIPAVYYHGFGPNKKPLGSPEYIGQAVKRWIDGKGVWFRVVLDRTSQLARRVWEAAQKGIARASSGSISHLMRVEPSGHIREWPVVELSIFDAQDGREPANRYAVAVPAAKAVYEQAGIALPDDIETAEPEAAARGAEASARPAAAKRADDKNSNESSTGVTEMELEEIKKAAREEALAAMKAERQAAEAEAKAKADEQARTDAAVKAAKAEWEAEAAKSRRLPGGAEPTPGMPYVTKYAYTVKFDTLTPVEHALMIDIMDSAYRKGLKTSEHPSDESIRALAMKMESEAAKGNYGCDLALKSFKGMGLKVDDIMHTDLSGYGSQWIGTLYSQQLWEMIRAECWVLNQLQPFSDVVPDGYSSDTVPLESTDPTWYKVAEASAHTSGRPDVTVTSSQFATGNKNITLAKMGCRVTFSGELTEDSLVAIAPQCTKQMKQSGLEQFEHVIIDGDTTTTASTNINSIAATPAGTESYLLVDGFRHLGLASNSRSAGALSEDDYLDTAKLLGTAGINADVTKCGFIVDMPTYWASLKLSTVKTKDVWPRATLESGQLAAMWGFPLKQSAFMHYKSTARKANTSGKVNQTDTTANTTGSILCVRWDQWRLKWKRRMTIETDRWPESDTNQIVAMVRWGLGYRDTSAAAISYGISNL